jgi:hypothetical protein
MTGPVENYKRTMTSANVFVVRGGLHFLNRPTFCSRRLRAMLPTEVEVDLLQLSYKAVILITSSTGTAACSNLVVAAVVPHPPETITATLWLVSDLWVEFNHFK